MFKFTVRSLWNRRFVAALTVLAIGLSVALILGVERLRDGARDSFANSASGIDLIVAPRGDGVQILLSTVFGVGGSLTGMSWDSYERLAAMPGIAWAEPIQMGDSHRGHPVIGVTARYFTHFRHSGGRAPTPAAGAFFTAEATDRVVIGAEVAARFGYRPGDVIINAHGAGEVSLDMHDDTPFTISGVLAATGTATDRMLFVPLAGFDALHAAAAPVAADPLDLAAMPARNADDDHEGDHEGGHDAHAPDKINAIYPGLSDRAGVLNLRRAINDMTEEPLSAVIPAVALTQLWSITGAAESVMRLMARAVAVAGMIAMVVMLSATLDTRRREFAILRSVGATPARIFGLIVTEAAILTAAGAALGLALLAAATLIAGPILSARFGLQLGGGLTGPRASWPPWRRSWARGSSPH